MFGSQHGGHLLEVGDVALVLHADGEAERDYPLCDVDQVYLIVLLHGQNHTLASGVKHRNRVFVVVVLDVFSFTFSLVTGHYLNLGFIKPPKLSKPPIKLMCLRLSKHSL